MSAGMHGPLTPAHAEDVDRFIGRVERHQYLPRSGAIAQYIDQVNGQVTHSVLYAPCQVTHWAWVALGLLPADETATPDVTLPVNDERPAGAAADRPDPS